MHFLKKLVFPFAFICGVSIFIFLYFEGNHHNKNLIVLVAYVASILLLYFYSIAIIVGKLDLFEVDEAVSSVVLFFLVMVLMISIFASAWFYFETFTKSEITLLMDSFYLSTIAFTTVGYGDYVINNPAGKLLLLTEALLGTTHTASFLAIVFLKLKKP